MDTLFVASAVLDCGAVAAIGWLLRRSARERDATREAERAALERLREDLAQLVCDAEKRSRGLGAALDAREKRLRALVAETGRLEAARPAPAPSHERPDPAEARLLRDLERSVPGAVPRLGNDGLKIPNGRADIPVGSRQAVRGSSDEGQ